MSAKRVKPSLSSAMVSHHSVTKLEHGSFRLIGWSVQMSVAVHDQRLRFFWPRVSCLRHRTSTHTQSDPQSAQSFFNDQSNSAETSAVNHRFSPWNRNNRRFPHPISSRSHSDSSRIRGVPRASFRRTKFKSSKWA